MTNTTPNPRRIVADRYSLLAQLERFVADDAIWDLVEQLDAFHQSRYGPPSRHSLMDILVSCAATHLCGSERAAVDSLGDPDNWMRLSDAAVAAFPNDPQRRLSQRAPSRSQLYRARRRFLSGDALDVLRRGMRVAALDTATAMGMFDPNAGSWAHPDKSQCIVGDAAWLPANTSGTNDNKPTNCYRLINGNGQPPTAVPGRQLVVLAVRGATGNERVLLDAEFRDEAANGAAATTEAEQATGMLRRLLDEHGKTLRYGLRGFIYDMAMTAKDIDTVLDMGVLPIVKVPRSPGGRCRHIKLGIHNFTATDGTVHAHDVITVAGAPAIRLVDSRGEEVLVPLRRRQVVWRNGRSRHIAYGGYVISHAPPVPTHLRNARTVIRHNSLNDEAASGARRTKALRAIPESDPDFAAVYGRREDIEATFADLKQRHRTLQSDLAILTYWMLKLVTVRR